VQIGLFAKGSEPPPSGDGVLARIESALPPAQVEGKRGEAVPRYRIAARLIGSPMKGEMTTVTLDADPPGGQRAGPA
jgi:hypothetical protein